MKWMHFVRLFGFSGRNKFSAKNQSEKHFSVVLFCVDEKTTSFHHFLWHFSIHGREEIFCKVFPCSFTWSILYMTVGRLSLYQFGIANGKRAFQLYSPIFVHSFFRSFFQLRLFTPFITTNLRSFLSCGRKRIFLWDALRMGTCDWTKRDEKSQTEKTQSDNRCIHLCVCAWLFARKSVLLLAHFSVIFM